MVDSNVQCIKGDAVKFWVGVYNMESLMGEQKYKNLATVALWLLSIPTSNADNERVFSHVRRIKIDFRSSPFMESLIIGFCFNKTSKVL